jgi:MFS family permease
VELAAALATLAIGPLAGVFVDRWDKRRTMLRMDLARGLLILLLLVVTGLLPAPFSLQLPLAAKLVAIYVILLLVGVCSQFFRPSRMALIGDIVGKEQRSHAMGLSQAAFNSALILGPMLAAPLFMAFGARWAMLIDAASFFISYLCILLIKAPPAARSVSEHVRGLYLRELRAGWKMIVSTRALIALIVNGVLLLAGAGTLDAFYVLFALTNLHTPTNLAGLFGPI